MKQIRRLNKVTIICLCLLVPAVVVTNANALGKCDSRYPVVLAHGMFFSADILNAMDYWYGIKETLVSEGAAVYITSVSSMAGTSAKAIAFKEQFMNILAQTGANKLNIIGHSHGGIYARDAITRLGIGPYVASYTSINTPHRGSAIADMVRDGDSSLSGLPVNSANFVYSFFMGDVNPDTGENMSDISTDYMRDVFNPNTPDHPGIYYQSWASKVKTTCIFVVLNATWPILLAIEGDNDGVVSIESAKWGNFRGVISGSFFSPGVDHAGVVNQPLGVTGFNALDFYVDLVADLKTRGY